jgi:integral membrane sensor domain MASE1
VRPIDLQAGRENHVRWVRRHAFGVRLAICFIAVLMASVFIGYAPEANLIWVANGLMLAYLLLAPRRRWRAYLAAGFVAQVAGSMLVDRHWRMNLFLAALNTIEVLIGALLLRRRSRDLPCFTDRKYLLRFLVFGALAGQVVSGIICAAVTVLTGHAHFWSRLASWIAADGLGAAVVTPACVAIFQERFKNTASLKRNWGGVLICFCAILFAICIVVFWAWPRLRSDRFDLLSDQNLAKLGPVFPKGIPVNDSRIDDYIGTASIKIGKVLRGYRERLDRSSDDSSVLHLKRLNPLYRYIPNLFDSVVRKDYAASEMAYGSFVVDDGCFIDRQELNSNSSFEATCWGFPYVDQMHRPHVSRIDLQRSAVKCHANPSPLVFSHDAELAVHHMILIYRDSDQGTGKGHNAPISKTGAFNKFSKSHRWFLFLISLPLGAFGGFALILGGIYFAIERPNLCYFLLCILLSTLSFALIFAFAHIVYD